MFGAVAQAGYKVAATWGAAFVAADTRLTIVSENITANVERLASEALVGSSGAHQSEAYVELCSGDITFELDYNNCHDLLGYALGYGSTGNYYPADPFPDTKYFHLTIDKYTRRWYFRSCCVNSVEITGSSGDSKPITVTLNVTAYACTRDATVFPTLTFTTPNRAFFKHITYFRIGDQADALAAGDNFRINSFSLRMENNLKTDDKDTGSATNLVEPIRNGFRKCTFKFGFPRYLSIAETIQALTAADTALQATMNLTDGADAVNILIAQMKGVDGPGLNVGGPGAIGGEFTLDCYRNLTNTGNMPTVAEEFRINVT